MTFISVTLLWVLFRATSLEVALAYYEVLFNFKTFNLSTFNLAKDYIVFISLFIVWFLPNSLEFTGYIKKNKRLTIMYSFVGAILFFIALKTMAETPAQTFVYFNF